MGWENLLGCIFSCLLTQYKLAKREIFMTVLQKDKLNLDYICNITYLKKDFPFLTDSPNPPTPTPSP